MSRARSKGGGRRQWYAQPVTLLGLLLFAYTLVTLTRFPRVDLELSRDGDGLTEGAGAGAGAAGHGEKVGTPAAGHRAGGVTAGGGAHIHKDVHGKEVHKAAGKAAGIVGGGGAGGGGGGAAGGGENAGAGAEGRAPAKLSKAAQAKEARRARAKGGGGMDGNIQAGGANHKKSEEAPDDDNAVDNQDGSSAFDEEDTGAGASEQSVSEDARKAEAEAEAVAAAHAAEYRPPEVESVDPKHGPRAGGIVVLVRGKHFGPLGTKLQVLLGGQPCDETRWMSETALHCLVPKGVGVKLPVEVVPCSCLVSPKPKPKHGKHVVVKTDITFSFDEDAMKGVMAMDPPLVVKQPGIIIQMHQEQLANPYEIRYMDFRIMKPGFFAILPSVPASLPRADLRTRHQTCAVVGTSGSLLGSRLGMQIDRNRAVFRVDNAPSAYRYAADVGKRTTYQVLSQEWVDVLLGAGESGPHVARWWLDVATLVLWSDTSQDSYVQLRWLYPDASVVLISRDLLSLIRSVKEAANGRIKDALMVEMDVDSAPTSLMISLFMALQVCDKVNIYGVFPRCGRHSRCRHTYFDDSEPTLSERDNIMFEQKFLLALNAAGHVNTSTPIRGTPPANTAAEAATPLAVEAAPRVAGKCDRHQCRPTCSGRGRYVNGTCHCEPVYSGVNCETDKLVEQGAEAMEGIEVMYDGALLMSKSQVIVVNPDEPEIEIPHGITRNRTGMGDSFKLDNKVVKLLPDNDLWLFDDAVAERTLKRIPEEEGRGEELKTGVGNLKRRGLVSLGRCALVGNSGSTNYHSYGPVIDNHDVVYRFNQGPTQGFQRHVGSRATHESLNSAWVKAMLEGKHGRRWNWRKKDTNIVLFEMFDPASFKVRSRDQIMTKEKWWRKMYTTLRNKHEDRKVIVLDPKFISWGYMVYQDFKDRFAELGLGAYQGEKPMSGFYAILFCLQACDQVDLYGFTPYRESDRLDALAAKYHYFDAAVPRHNSHSFDLTRYVYELFDAHLDNFTIYD